MRNGHELRIAIEAREVSTTKNRIPNNMIKTLKKENLELRNKVELLDRDSPKNNLIMFGLNSYHKEVSVAF